MNNQEYLSLKNETLTRYEDLQEILSQVDVSTSEGCSEFLSLLKDNVTSKIVHTCEITDDFKDEVKEFIKYYNFGVLKDELKQKAPVFYKYMGKDYKLRNRTRTTISEFLKVLKVFLRKLKDTRSLSVIFLEDDITYLHEKYYEGKMKKLWVAPCWYDEDIQYIRVSVNSIEEDCERSVSSGVHSRVPLNSIIAFLIHYGVIKDIIGGEGTPHKTQKYCRCFKVSQGYLNSIYRENVDRLENLSSKDKSVISFKRELSILEDPSHKLHERVMSLTKSLKSILSIRLHGVNDKDILSFMNHNYSPLVKIIEVDKGQEKNTANHIINLYLHDSFRLIKQHTIDDYGNRMYTLFTSLNKKLRPYITFNEENLYEADANCAAIRSVFLMVNDILSKVSSGKLKKGDEVRIQDETLTISELGLKKARMILKDKDHVFNIITREMGDIRNDFYHILYKYSYPDVVDSKGHVDKDFMMSIPEFTKDLRSKLKKKYIKDVNSSSIKINGSLRSSLYPLTRFFIEVIPFYKDILTDLSIPVYRPVLNQYKVVRIDSKTGKPQMKMVMISPIAKITQSYESERISKIVNALYVSSELRGRVQAATVHDAVYFSIKDTRDEDLMEVKRIYKQIFGSDVKIEMITNV